MTPLVRRIVREQRLLILLLAAGLLANVLVFALLVYPRSVRAANVADRAAAAAQARQAAERELVKAKALIAGKARADEDLAAFFQRVLPRGRQEARRMMDETLPVLADRADVQWLKRTSDIAPVSDDGPLMELSVTMVLQGEYDDLRNFIHAVESAPEFIVVDDVMLAEGRANEPLMLTVRMSTYYQANNGS
jgi:Tfp pilus assembly protein PilO